MSFANQGFAFFFPEKKFQKADFLLDSGLLVSGLASKSSLLLQRVILASFLLASFNFSRSAVSRVGSSQPESTSKLFIELISH